MRKLSAVAITLLVLSGTLLAGHGHGRGNGRGNGKGNGWYGRRAPVGAVAPGPYGGFGGGYVSGGYYVPQRDLDVVGDYYRHAYPGGRGLPPGLARRYSRGGVLPPGWQRKIRPFPGAYRRRLSPLPGPYRRGLLNGIYVVYDPIRGLIVDATAAIGF